MMGLELPKFFDIYFMFARVKLGFPIKFPETHTGGEVMIPEQPFGRLAASLRIAYFPPRL
jgi:hypothetical protein